MRGASRAPTVVAPAADGAAAGMFAVRHIQKRAVECALTCPCFHESPMLCVNIGADRVQSGDLRDQGQDYARQVLQTLSRLVFSWSDQRPTG